MSTNTDPRFSKKGFRSSCCLRVLCEAHLVLCPLQAVLPEHRRHMVWHSSVVQGLSGTSMLLQAPSNAFQDRSRPSEAFRGLPSPPKGFVRPRTSTGPLGLHKGFQGRSRTLRRRPRMSTGPLKAFQWFPRPCQDHPQASKELPLASRSAAQVSKEFPPAAMSGAPSFPLGFGHCARVWTLFLWERYILHSGRKEQGRDDCLQATGAYVREKAETRVRMSSVGTTVARCRSTSVLQAGWEPSGEVPSRAPISGRTSGRPSLQFWTLPGASTWPIPCPLELTHRLFPSDGPP